jgi:thiamine kinase-like enzyme
VTIMHEEISVPELTEVVARVSALLGPRQGAVTVLEGGITNRNFRVNFGGTDYVVRLPGKDTELLGINREAERLATRRAAELGLGPKVAAMLDEPPCLITCFVANRAMGPDELRRPEAIGEVAHALRAFHETPLELPTEFNPLEIAAGYGEVVRAHGKPPPPEFGDTLKRAREVVETVREHPEHAPVPSHNDLLPSNFLHDGRRILIVDWEYAGLGDRFFDLGNFAVNNELAEADADRLLEAYFREPPTSRRRAALNLFRFVSDFREAMWGLVQSSVSSVAFDFDAYAAKHFRRLAETGADARFLMWLEEARKAGPA